VDIAKGGKIRNNVAFAGLPSNRRHTISWMSRTWGFGPAAVPKDNAELHTASLKATGKLGKAVYFEEKDKIGKGDELAATTRSKVDRKK